MKAIHSSKHSFVSCSPLLISFAVAVDVLVLSYCYSFCVCVGCCCCSFYFSSICFYFRIRSITASPMAWPINQYDLQLLFQW
jgi:hypothetical protein